MKKPMKKVLPKKPREGDCVIELILIHALSKPAQRCFLSDYVIELDLIPIVFKVVNVISSLADGAYVTELDLILSAQKSTFSQIPVLMPQNWI